MRYAWKAILCFCLLLAGFVAPSLASVPKVVFDEEFGWAT